MIATVPAPAARPTVVLIGGGFGGLAASRALKRAAVRVVVIDRSNHHLFQPLLYQVATAALNPSDIAAPIRRILRGQRNAEVLLAEVRGFDLDGRRVLLDDGEMAYDALIVAAGATHSYFGRDEWAGVAPGLKSIDDALDIRRRILSAFEAAEREADPARRTAWMTFVIVGAGPTGVELAGTLTEVARHTLARDFRRIDPAQARVILVEGSPHVLPAYVPELSTSARRQLERLGVEVRVGMTAADLDDGGVTLADGERIAARTVIWAAGVAASPLGARLGAPVDRNGRVQVEPDLSIPGHPEVFVIGDLAAIQQDGKPVPGVAPAAMQMGDHAAANVLRRLDGEPTRPFHYVDKGSLATIGRASGIAQFGRLKVSGFLAWSLWLFVHILFLIGFRNRLLVLIEWAWSYVTYDRGARLITGRAHDLMRRGSRAIDDSPLPPVDPPAARPTNPVAAP